jgi:hypothetical protein
VVNCYVLNVVQVSEAEFIKEMIIAIVDAENLLDAGVSCAQMERNYAIGYNNVSKKAKAAAGL